MTEKSKKVALNEAQSSKKYEPKADIPTNPEIDLKNRPGMAIENNHNILLKLLSLFEEKIFYDIEKEKAFDTIYTELKQYKDNFIFLSQKPIFLDLILLLDNLEKMQENMVKNSDIPEIVHRNFITLKEELLEILYRRDIEPNEQDQKYFTPGTLKAIKILPTTKKEEDKQIVKVIRRGYKWGAKILRTEEVIIKKFTPENTD